MWGARWARLWRLGRSALQAAMRSAGVLAVFIPLSRVYVRHIWLPDRRGGHRQRLHSRASGRPGPAPAPPRGRANAGAARRLWADLHVVFTRYCSALLMTRLKATQRRYTRSPRVSAAPRALCFSEACASIGSHARHFARAADAASACSSGATAAHVVSPNNPQPRSERRSRRWVWAPRRRFTRSRARIVSGDENLRLRKCSEPISRLTDVTSDAGKLALQHGRRLERCRRRW